MTDKVNKQDAPDLPAHKVLTAADIERIREDKHSCGHKLNPNPRCGCMCGRTYMKDDGSVLIDRLMFKHNPGPKCVCLYGVTKPDAPDVESGRPMSAEQKVDCSEYDACPVCFARAGSRCWADQGLVGITGYMRMLTPHNNRPKLPPTEQPQDPLPPLHDDWNQRLRELAYPGTDDGVDAPATEEEVKRVCRELRASQAETLSLKAQLSEMTEDRDLWQGEHSEDCPNPAALAEMTALALTKSNVDAEAVLVEMTALAAARLDVIKGLEESDKTLRKDLEIAVADVVELREALVRAERKLSAYVGVCKGDKELTDTVLPMARAALAPRKANQDKA
jgi:hypothetical protein